MIAAIYSTDQNGIGDEERTVTRQIEHAKAYAAQKGWMVSEDYVYVDDGISGAEFVKRPRFLRVMNVLNPKPLFQVLIMSEESRIDREQIETSSRSRPLPMKWNARRLDRAPTLPSCGSRGRGTSRAVQSTVMTMLRPRCPTP
jgi:Resolvase, N terminal domain